MKKRRIEFIFIGIVIVSGILFLAYTAINDRNGADVSDALKAPVGGAPGEIQNSKNQSDAVRVIMTDNGFDPAIVTVKKGDSVFFENRSGEMMLVASDPHPQHDQYPGFAMKEGTTRGESYYFTFDSSGVWGYHNHLNPEKTGIIVVI
ncbi:hypothetical protein A3D05_05570 [Candidatus Gottesmanbacteria bacterium RIFCSPHIGHO2_02_FULL_40_24]|uniref:EfeO-type cupredoxin-like domain-containing protein n=1 Tax=Candidatus Gottesmanbacteria bacterium RIFCSPHIGHO2_01_FULL_40_15 TaxID=1798376 RepID=A0A1F5Z6V9_9BACT|nr:MAG: hypothetical protein A2777_02205 [Candidatus Gottesmanbacteria bacterium RIFCSPHIGHO2_01_FULL_40_15]OGG16498.1 MAG: hypothetical protein A3D05_05570 [Candidatus Gottesmanbacteria bacterium RIFCSPHIGHO2_02_FULL_40_24]OGG22576.1 MAG: hypothetical protein A3B48_02045 [Candidatus Gottesmanbacteria bacterium RIFCSPLOWO2_01_FULL_40_10]OGG25611.1 MAG: hypothetical protein A3E42_04720 [Candidatus Gottesmanbacteria bacterium RIFCSPHIGHO2_12_FULL_40_13]OGG32615.1 MAG: hypothetical protein A3I80_0